MKEDIREKIALKRYKIISPVLAEPKRVQNEYFRKQAQREHDFPRYGLRKFSVSTMKAWLRKYRKNGFEALKPKSRRDSGRPRRLDQQTLKAIEVKCKAYPYWTVQKLYENLRDQDLLGEPPVHYNTLLRLVKEYGWLAVKARTDVRKAYEVDNVNDLWVCDFMHGPKVRNSNRSIKAILCAIIDDHSRMVVGHAFNASETISSLTLVLKEAFLGYGIPKRLYVDNGPSFSSELLFEAVPWPAYPLPTPSHTTAPPAGKLNAFSELSEIVSSPGSKRVSASKNSTRPSGCGSRRTTTTSCIPASGKDLWIATMPPSTKCPSEDSPRRNWMRSSSSAMNAWSITMPPSASKVASMRYPRPISDTESRSDTQSTTPKTFISMTVMCGWAESNWWIKRKTPVPSGPRRSPPSSPFTKGGFSHEGSTGLVRTQTLPF